MTTQPNKSLGEPTKPFKEDGFTFPNGIRLPITNAPEPQSELDKQIVLYPWVKDTSDPLFDTKQELTRAMHQYIFPDKTTGKLTNSDKLILVNVVNYLMKFYIRPIQEQITAAYRKGYQAGHQKGKTDPTYQRPSRAYRGTKAASVLEHFIERLPADSKRCKCLTCKVINDRWKRLKDTTHE